MGWDIVSIGKHNIRTTDVKTVAEELSKRFHINICYGYFADYKYADGSWVRGSGDWLPLGDCRDHEGGIEYRLEDHYYWAREVDGSNIPYGKFPFELVDRKEALVYYELDTPSDSAYSPFFYIDIYPELCSVHLTSEPFRWMGFHKYFESDYEPYTEHDEDYLRDYRYQLRNHYKALGSDSIIFHNDQGYAAFLLDDVRKTWSEFLLEIERKGLRCINIAEFMIASEKPYSTNPDDVFFDDFSDL